MNIKVIRSTTFLAALVAAVLLTGCGTSGVGDILGGGSGSDRYDPAGENLRSVRGTVERIDTRDRFLVVDVEDTSYRTDLRNGNEDEEIRLYYDDRTTVEHEGRTYSPQDLEPGDRILAEVERSGDRLMAEDIDVLHDATNAGIGRDDDLRTSELRGTVRYVDTRDRTLEIERSSGYSTGRSDLVVVHYDTDTIVEFEGRRYQPENLERGDVVEVELSDLNGRLMAEEILVVGESSVGR